MNDIDERDERLGELLDRSLHGIEPISDVVHVIGRGSRRRASRWIASVSFVVVFVIAVVGAAIMVHSNRTRIPGAGETPSPTPSPAWITYRDDAHGFEVTYPSDWFHAAGNLTPHLTSPIEILSLASYPLVPNDHRLAFDGYVPGAAADVGGGGIFITLQEAPGSPKGFHDRPVSFDPAVTGTCPQGHCLGIPLAGPDCPPDYACPNEPGYHAWWISFHDQGRGFYAFVAMGDNAFKDRARYDLAWQVLDSLRFDPAS